ncbi:MAG: EMC3/TMCO1 family protein, partial [Nanoarchaeota archaeon]
FNPVLLPLADKSPLLLIVLFSFVLSLIITVVYKFATNQEEMKRLKEQQKESQKHIKELRTSNPEEALRLQKEAMKSTGDMMKHSFKAMLITLVIAAFTFPWMSAHLAYDPIAPEETYSLTATFAKGITGDAVLIPDKNTKFDSSSAKQSISNSEVTWRLKSGLEGEQILTVKTGEVEQQKKVLISNELEYEEPIAVFKSSDIEKITINYEKFTPLGNFHISSWYPGWLAIYFVSSIVFSLSLRKLLKVY